MRFWDSSALVPLLVRQSRTAAAKKRWENDPEVVLWTLTPVEATSALRRLVREGSLEEKGAVIADRTLEELVLAAHIVIDVERVKVHARRVLRMHPLRAADALQLGAALTWARSNPSGCVFHSFDDRLALAATKEGFIATAD